MIKVTTHLTTPYSPLTIHYMKNPAILKIHAAAGLLSGLFILLMSLSGSVLVFHEELDSWQYPVIVKQTDQPVLSIDSCYKSLQKRYPHAQVSHLNIAENSSQPYVFTVYDSSYQSGTKSMQVFMHPQTGAVLQTRGGGKDIKHNAMGWLSVFHNSFHLGKKGEWLLGFFALVFLLSIATGTILYRKKIGAVILLKKAVFTWSNLHQIIGVYALLFNLMIGITGYWMQRYVFKKQFYATEQPYTPVLKPSPPLFFRIDSAFEHMQKQHPAFTGYVIYFAQSKKGKTAVYGSRYTNSFIHSKKFADVIFLDSTGTIAKTAFVDKIDADSRYDIINSQIHFGRYGGMPVKILYSLLGLASGLLSITGFALWLKRKSWK
jgi:uncharacterized iron-regulated membrane protein